MDTSNQMFEEFNSEMYNDAMDTSQQEVGISEESSIEQSNILYGTNINTEEYRLVFPYCGDDGNGIIINCDQQFQEFNPGLYAINLANTNPKIAEGGLIFIQEQTNTSEHSNVEDVDTRTHNILSTGNSDRQGNTEENEESSQEFHFQFSCTKKDDAGNEAIALSEETVIQEDSTVNNYVDDPDDPDIIDICTDNANDSNNDNVSKMSIESSSLTSLPRSTNMYIAVTEKNIFAIHGMDVSLPISCDICGEDFNDMAQFDDHMSTHVEHRHFMCQLCPKTYASWENLVAHRKVSHQGQVISCEQCSCSKHHHKLGPLKFPVGKFPSGCEECNKGFSTSSQLNKHYRIHATDGCNKEKIEPSNKMKSPSHVTQNDVKLIEKDKVEVNAPSSSNVTCSTAKVNESNFMEAVPSTSGIQNTRKVSVYKCNKCQKELLSIQALKLHTKSQCCATGIQYKCPYCCSVFNDMISYRNHKFTHKEKAYEPQKSMKKIANKVATVTNVSSHPSVDVYHCFNCQMNFSTPRDMQQHIERVHYQRPNVKLTCDICSSNQPVNHFMKHYLLCMRSKRAQNILNEKSKFVCFECDNVYNEAKALLEHKKTHLSTDKTYICEICGIMMHQLSAFNKHLVSHSPYRKNFPETVHSEDTSKNKLTSRNNISSYMCEYCGREFKTKTSLQLHIRRHTGEKPYQCTYCSKAFYTGQQLSVHVRQHTGERPYHCPVCKKSFSSATVLYTHKKVHTTTTQHACPVCGKKFFWRSAYHNHMRIHSGNRPFKCEICSKTFLFKNRLTAHIKRHEEGKISNFIYDLNQTQEIQLHYQCSDCGQSFSSPQELENHHEEKCYLTMITFLPQDSDTNKDNSSLVYLDSTNDSNTFCEEQQVAF